MKDSPYASGSLPYFCRAVAEASLSPAAGVEGPGHIVRYANPAICFLTGRPREQLLGSAFSSAMPGDEECVSMLDRVFRTGNAETHTGQEGSAERSPFWSYSMSPVIGVEDVPLGILFQVTESTSFHRNAVAMNQALLLGSVRQHELMEKAELLNQQMQAEIFVSKQAQEELTQKELLLNAAVKEKDVLLGEIHHRVKNNLQIIYSLLDLQCSQIDNPLILAMLRDSQNRIRSMALIHQTLYQSKDFARVDFQLFLDSLASTLIDSYFQNPDRILLSVQARDIHLPIHTAIPCGLLVNELISNCLKHAFPSGRRGRIDIDFVREPWDQVMLSVTDDGIGIAEDLDLAQTSSLGLQLVFLLTEQLGGEMTVDRSNPTRFVLRFMNRDAARKDSSKSTSAARRLAIRASPGREDEA